jgi:hypothetical protein
MKRPGIYTELVLPEFEKDTNDAELDKLLERIKNVVVYFYRFTGMNQEVKITRYTGTPVSTGTGGYWCGGEENENL